MDTKGKGKTKEAVGRRQRVDRTGLSRVTECCGRQTAMEAAGGEIIGGALRPSGSRTDRER